MKKFFDITDTTDALIISQEYNKYMFAVSMNVIRLMISIIGLFNLVLLAADFFNIQAADARLAALILRIAFIILMIVLLIYLKQVKTYKVFGLLITIYEFAAVCLFLVIFNLYSQPDYFIQLLGLMILVLAVFIIPNLWYNMMAVALIGSIGFFIFAYFTLNNLNEKRFFISIIYVAMEILLCAGVSLYYRQYQQNEFYAKKELLRIYSTDPLTKVGNRVKLENEADRWMEFCSRHKLDLALVLIDIDDMKKINDERGHLVGDVILYEAAQIMSNQLRKNDVCVRWGGDEFVLLLPKTNMEQARQLSLRIKEAFANQDVADNLRITCSFGIASMHKGDSLDLLVQQADTSMYAAKKQGKNAVQAGK